MQANNSRNTQLLGRLEKSRFATTVCLRFQLRGVNVRHPYLASRGIREATAREFGIGSYSGPGLMSRRLMIPIQDAAGRLVAYGGRSLDGSEPRYRFPAGFAKSQVLFNLHRAIAIRPVNGSHRGRFLRLPEGISGGLRLGRGLDGIGLVRASAPVADAEFSADRPDARWRCPGTPSCCDYIGAAVRGLFGTHRATWRRHPAGPTLRTGPAGVAGAGRRATRDPLTVGMPTLK